MTMQTKNIKSFIRDTVGSELDIEEYWPKLIPDQNTEMLKNRLKVEKPKAHKKLKLFNNHPIIMKCQSNEQPGQKKLTRRILNIRSIMDKIPNLTITRKTSHYAPDQIETMRNSPLGEHGEKAKHMRANRNFSNANAPK